MKETILDVLMYMFQSYVEDNEEVELDKESLHKNLAEAGFADQNIEKALVIVASSDDEDNLIYSFHAHDCHAPHLLTCLLYTSPSPRD